MATVKVFGADWCSMTKRTLAHLDHLGVPYDYVDIDNDEASRKWVAAQNNGREKKPTLDILGKILVEPSNAELDAALEEQGIQLGR